MEVVHDTGSLSIRKNVADNAGFLLTNKKGSYCSFFNGHSSRYHGLFYFDEKEMSMYKFIESIEVGGCGKLISLKNYFYFAERRKEKISESFLMPKNSNSLMYWLSAEKEIDVVLDCKRSYDCREWGRNYEIFREKGCIVVKFTKKTDKREGEIDGALEFVLYLAIKGNKSAYEINGRWIEREYHADEERNSPPFKRHAYNALRLKGSKFVFSMSKNKSGAIRECADVFSRMDILKIQEKQDFLGFLKNKSIKKVMRNEKISSEIKVSYISALNSLNNLAVCGKGCKGIFAGLPWFFQFWARDSLVSLKSLSKIKDVKPIIFGYLDKIGDDGRLKGADSHGWLFLRCQELAEKISRDKKAINSIKEELKIFNVGKNKSFYSKTAKLGSLISKKENEYQSILYEIESALEKSLSALLKYHTSDNFEVNGPKETWMDTEFGGDGRKGMRIEIQALRLNMYALMYGLSQNHNYRALENILKIKVRQEFFNGKVVADGLCDFTIRPNIFIAAYAYPEFLSQEEWETCFSNALKSIWLEWGGLSTIDKSSPLYSGEHTGENAKSYHRGDSWFWINNLAALVLSRTNKDRFKSEIKKIAQASTEEILWKGCVGCHSELSDAKELSGKGCFSQAWSSAMYLEMIDEAFQ